MAMKKQKSPHEGAGHKMQSSGHGGNWDGGETPTSTPVAGAKTGGGVSYGLAEHNMKSGQDKDTNTFHSEKLGHFMADHHKGSIQNGAAQRFSHTQNKGPYLRVSGHSGAHQLGCKK